MTPQRIRSHLNAAVEIHLRSESPPTEEPRAANASRK